LGYIGHLVHLLSKILQVTLRYEIIPGGSRSHIRDHLPHKKTAFSTVYPLYWRGVHANKFKFAMTLLQYNINHILVHRGVKNFYPTQDHMLYKLMQLFEHELGGVA
jgi:hypothetical protein|tara:strand:+ start:1933 stop:2250 length:318 start_codon:yes stop_codon:yes gene_type:complete